MSRWWKYSGLSFVFFSLFFPMTLAAQVTAHRVPRIIDESNMVALHGNVHPLARAEFDRGVAEPATPMRSMMLLLKPTDAQQSALDALLEAQHDPTSAQYRQWLTPEQYGERFGLATADLLRLNDWLQKHGFTVEEIPANHRVLIFSGTAAQVQAAFQTEIHQYSVNGEAHYANAQDPQIPAALTGVVSGVLSLHNFGRQSQIHSRVALGSRPQYSSGSTHYLAPADYATIYDLSSIYSGGNLGAGVTIAVIGRSDISLTDVSAFRTFSGLSANQPTVVLAGNDPGTVSGDQDESTLDVEWAGATAPSATVKFVVAASTNSTDGIDTAAQYAVTHAIGQVISVSYGSCESSMGSSEMNFYSTIWAEAASQGQSALISSGDSGAAGCNGGSNTTGSGRGVNGLCSSLYSTCVGGTEFNEGSNASQYWSATNSAAYGSAISYIPEVVWNESASNGGTGLWSSGGGASIYYAQPSWQSGVNGVSAANGMRAVPDVAMTAAGHDGYLINENGSFWIISGTSASTPSLAGVIALLVQSQGGTGVGNANTGLYPLVNAASNPFHATLSGNNTVPGVTGFTASGTAYNLATGLGSVDGAVLLHSWGSGSNTSTIDLTLSESVNSATVQPGKTATFTVSVTETNNNHNAVALSANPPSGVTITFSPSSITPGTNSTATVTVTQSAAAGLDNITISGADTTGTRSLNYALTVSNTPQISLSSTSASYSVAQSGSTAINLTAQTGGTYAGTLTFTVSGLPTGVTAQWSNNPTATLTGSQTMNETLTLNATSSATLGSATITVTAAGDGISSQQNLALLVTVPPGVSLSYSPATVSVQSLSSTTVTVTATPVGGVTLPAGASGSTMGISSGLPAGFTAGWSAATIDGSGEAVWVLTLTGSSTAVASTSSLSISGSLLSSTGKSYAVAKTLPMSVTLTPPTLSIAAASNTLSVTKGSSVPDTFTLTGNGTFTGNVTLSVSGLPTGVTAAWKSNPVTMTNHTGTGQLTLTAASAAATANATVTITAKGSGVTTSTTVALQVTTAPGVQLVAQPASLSMQSLSGTTATIVASPAGGVVVASGAAGSSISITSGLPTGVTATWGSPTVNGSGAVVWPLTLTGSSAAKASNATLNFSTVVASNAGSSYTATLKTPLTVTLTPPTLGMTPALTSLTVAQNSTVSDVMTLTGNGTFSGNVVLSVVGLPAGVTATWLGNNAALSNGTGTPTLTLSASATAATGTKTFTVTAVGGGLSVTKTITLQTVTGLGIKLASASTSLALQSLASTTATVTATPQGGLSIAAPLGGSSHSSTTPPSISSGTSIVVSSGLPSGVTASWSAATLNGNGTMSWTLTLTGSSTALAANSTLVIAAVVQGSNGKYYSASASVALKVTLSPATLSLSPASATAALSAGGSVSDVMTLTGNATFSGNIQMSISGLPTGVTATWSANPLTLTQHVGTTSLVLRATSAVATGSRTLLITAKGGGLTVTQQITLQVQAASNRGGTPILGAKALRNSRAAAQE